MALYLLKHEILEKPQVIFHVKLVFITLYRDRSNNTLRFDVIIDDQFGCSSRFKSILKILYRAKKIRSLKVLFIRDPQT